MTRIFSLFFLHLFLSISLHASTLYEKEISIEVKGGHLKGTLQLTANTLNPVPVVLIIAGSGPTDRDCNNPYMKNDAYKLLAMSLAENGIASFRYDKRGIAMSNDFTMTESEVRFDDFVQDAVACIKYLKTDKKFSKVIVAGHSEGSQIGMIACAQTNADGFISLNGAGRTIDVILKEQLASQPKSIKKPSYKIIDQLKAGKTVSDVPLTLISLFRESVQPYLISWMQLDPAKEISELKIPVLIISGANDLQVSKTDAEKLKEAKKDAELKIIDGMNHIFRTGFNSTEENAASYNNPALPISEDLVKSISDFVKKL